LRQFGAQHVVLCGELQEQLLANVFAVALRYMGAGGVG
jgi:hypothetical protein